MHGGSSVESGWNPPAPKKTPYHKDTAAPKNFKSLKSASLGFVQSGKERIVAPFGKSPMLCTSSQQEHRLKQQNPEKDLQVSDKQIFFMCFQKKNSSGLKFRKLGGRSTPIRQFFISELLHVPQVSQ
ncbi:hypothetical protein AVEN_264753-1 [Araneus ventricosus]|uniref:Uncharacterized protein n=1 Tax=Araneus ventricosus TaxID=182803 RepID=A0A4Y2ECN8_ARAVE|nr:hypothetical protein AVEN_264753-1 [Araneus ventricosus]